MEHNRRFIPPAPPLPGTGVGGDTFTTIKMEELGLLITCLWIYLLDILALKRAEKLDALATANKAGVEHRMAQSRAAAVAGAAAVLIPEYDPLLQVCSWKAPLPVRHSINYPSPFGGLQAFPFSLVSSKKPPQGTRKVRPEAVSPKRYLVATPRTQAALQAAKERDSLVAIAQQELEVCLCQIKVDAFSAYLLPLSNPSCRRHWDPGRQTLG